MLNLVSKVVGRFRKGVKNYAFAGIVIILFGAYDLAFTVREGEAVIVTRWGKPVRVLEEAGPYVKLPSPIDQLHRVDRRSQVFTTAEAASFTQDKRNLVLTTFVVWRVDRPLVYLQSVGDAATAENSLAGMVLSAKNQVVGQFPLTSFLSLDPSEIQVNEIEQRITDQVHSMARQRMGIAVEQIGIERISFADENMAAVMERMRAERVAEANRIRAEGAKRAQAIRDETHVATQEILRHGREEAARILASAEAETAKLLAQSHAKNPEFFRFWSSLQASKRVLKDRSTLILATDQLIFGGLTEPTQATDGVLATQPLHEGLPITLPADSEHAEYGQR